MTHTPSPLPHTWVFDLDGTIVKHNGYKDGGGGLDSAVLTISILYCTLQVWKGESL
jgi:hypothetical protein